MPPKKKKDYVPASNFHEDDGKRYYVYTMINGKKNYSYGKHSVVLGRAKELADRLMMGGEYEEA